MQKRTIFITGFLFLLLATCEAAFAQGGGKAEPNRIEFKPGATATTVSGVVRNDEQAEYVVSARSGQRLTITLTNSPAKSSCFDLRGPNEVDLGLEYDCNWKYSKVLPATGDYLINISRPTQAKGTSRYRFTVTIK